MTVFERLRQLYRVHFSRPAVDRPLWRALGVGPVKRILQIGLGSGALAERMIRVAGSQSAPDQVRFTGIDLFEGRPETATTTLTLKEAHRRLKATGATVQLVPGDPFSALARVANSLSGTELVVISQEVDPEALGRAWFYLPRVLTPSARVFVEPPALTNGQPGAWQVLTPAEVQQLAGTRGRRAA